MPSTISTAAFVRLIFLKDVRALRYMLLVLFGMALTIVYFALNLNQEANLSLVPSEGTFFLLVGILLLTTHLIQSDPTGREFRFLLTRPVPGLAIGLAKALFLTVFVVLPYWLGLEFIAGGSHIPLTFLDHVLLFIETLVFCGATLTSLVLLSIFSRNGVIVFLVVLVSSIVTILLTEWLRERSWHTDVMPHWPSIEHERLSQFRSFLAKAIFFVGALFAIGIRYRTRTFKTPLALALGAAALSYLCFFFPYNLTEGLQDQSSTRSLMSPAQLGQIHMTLLQHPLHQPPYSLTGGDWNNVHYVSLNQIVQMDGIEPPYYVQTIGYQAVITLRSGKTITSNYDDFNGHGGVGGLSPAFMAKVADVLPPWPYQKELTLDLMSYLPQSLPTEDITGATVKGEITLEVRRAYVAGTIPLVPHASFDGLRRRSVITQTEFSPDAVTLNMDIYQLPLVLRGDMPNWNSSDDRQLLAIYRPYNEALAEGGTAFGSGTNFGVLLSQPRYTYKSVSKYVMPNWRPLPPDWSSGAELDFIGSDPCGRITCSYEIDNVDLHYRF